MHFIDKDELPPHWDRELLFGLVESDINSDSDDGLDSDVSTFHVGCTLLKLLRRRSQLPYYYDDYLRRQMNSISNYIYIY